MRMAGLILLGRICPVLGFRTYQHTVAETGLLIPPTVTLRSPATPGSRIAEHEIPPRPGRPPAGQIAEMSSERPVDKDQSSGNCISIEYCQLLHTGIEDPLIDIFDPRRRCRADPYGEPHRTFRDKAGWSPSGIGEPSFMNIPISLRISAMSSLRPWAVATRRPA